MNSLKTDGKYTVDADTFAKIKELFYGGFCSEEKTYETIKKTYSEKGYLIDTHTAVAVGVYNDYLKETGDDRPTVIASTASPYKFAASVLEALGEDKASDEFETVRKLSSVTNTAIPAPLAALEDATVRFTEVCDKDGMTEVVFKRLGI